MLSLDNATFSVCVCVFSLYSEKVLWLKADRCFVKSFFSGLWLVCINYFNLVN